MMDRRSFLKLATLASLPPAKVVEALQTSHSLSGKRVLQLNAYTLDAGTPLDLLTSYITPNDVFFIRSHDIPTRVDPKQGDDVIIAGSVSDEEAKKMTGLQRRRKG